MKLSILVPFLYSEAGGHFYIYNKAVQEALQKADVEVQVFVSKRHVISKLPENWHPLLDDALQILPVAGRRRLNFKEKTVNLFRLFCSFSKAVKSSPLIFMEEFRHRHLKMLYWALRLSGNSQATVILLHRYRPDWYPKNYRRYINKFKNLKLVTDSELLAKEQRLYFNKPITVLPIPHIHYREKRSPEGLLKAWWPGGVVRKEKGLLTIEKLSKEPHEDIELIVADNAKEHLGEQKGLVFVSKDLASKAYYELMASVDFCLLPYDQKQYAAATSGIFVEAISAGTLVFVSDNTWMAFELRRFGLDGLIIDWEMENLWPELKLRFLRYKDALKPMQEAYRSTHSPEGFFTQLLPILQGCAADQCPCPS